MGSFALNPSARSAVARVFSLDSTGKEEGLRDIWITSTATQSALFDRKFREAATAHEKNNRRECLRLCEEIVQQIDDLRPEVYVLLGQSAFADSDESMLTYAHDKLREFDSIWGEKLRRYISEQPSAK